MLKAWHFQGVSKSTVARMWVPFRTQGNVRYRHGGGREKVTTQLEDCFSVFQAQLQGFVKAIALQNDLQNANGVRISMQQIRNRIHRAGMRVT